LVHPLIKRVALLTESRKSVQHEGADCPLYSPIGDRILYRLPRFDQLDARLISALRNNPRVGLLEVARHLGVARGTVQARLQKLESSGVITGHGPEVDPHALGYTVTAFVLIELAQGRLGEAVSVMEGMPEVL